MTNTVDSTPDSQEPHLFTVAISGCSREAAEAVMQACFQLATFHATAQLQWQPCHPSVASLISPGLAHELLSDSITLMAEYKLDYPQDYEADDITRMRRRIDELEELQRQLPASTPSDADPSHTTGVGDDT